MKLATHRELALGMVFAALWFANVGQTAWAGAPNTLSAQEVQEGWLLLFDGETLFGWKPATKANWRVGDAAIRSDQGEPGLLCTTSSFADFVLKVDFRSPKGTTSGVLLRTDAKAAPEDAARSGYEVSIADPAEKSFPTGSLVKRMRCDRAALRPDWQTFEITAQGGRITVKLNGQQVLDYTDPQPIGRGMIGLRYRQGPIEFRNIKLKPLGLASIFNGRDLAGWKTYPQLKTVCSVTPEGWLRLQNGRGQLESAGQFADFILQLEVLVNGKGLNSGVFFRSIPGEIMNGYESQIHNGYLHGDRSKPADAGTGAIFRRQNARRVVPNDGEWFCKTILADGPHFAVWVNGYQVTDWIDTRPEHENPRKGLRLQAGTIILQGHDPTTDFFFRNLRIAEMPKRAQTSER